MQPRTLVIDIETSPILGHVWSLWNNNLGLEQIHQEWCILSFAAKWTDSKKVIYEDTFDNVNKEDDQHLVRSIHKLLDEADFVIAHNGKKFDVRKINARFILLGLKPPSPYRVIDTMLEARRTAAFTSNKLAWLTDKLTDTKKRSHGKFPGFLLWKEYLAGNPAARREMRLYNIDDVKSLEELYYVLRPWMVGHPNHGTYVEDTTNPVCPKCGSTHVHKRGVYHTQVNQYQRYQCTSCGGWSRGRLALTKAADKKHILIN
ncbi:DNA polymerase exonuclease subunit [Aquamicrobium phage P14]|uniref:Putative 3'-5' exonuclease n=1 Tax=Aquamicrobium phage P14 TaxID=1927013 RepID=A0A1L5C048_9CAUD|nr:DNA polymerase exonuclease subunit [Aquamicrobium phage P14]APL99486.1 putative 3'-5' exonuclease [Aquamicrobium phage P14]